MGILAWIVLGLVAGAIAKLILPGKQGGGWIITLLLGVVGAFVGGLLGNLVVGRAIGDLGDPWTWILAIVGAIIVLLIYGAITNRGRARA